MIDASASIDGIIVEPDSARKSRGDLYLQDDGCVTLSCESEQFIAHIDELEIADALGDIPRTVRFPNGWAFTPSDNHQLNQWLKLNNKHSWLHGLEQKKSAIAAACVVTALATYLFIVYGIPGISQTVANALPDSIHQAVGRHTVSVLDKHLLEPSELEPDQQLRVTNIFDDLDANSYSPYGEPQLLFRKLGSANAFALAGGTVVISDKMVKLADNDEELAGVLLHELGHQQHNHVMTRLVQSTFVSIIAAYVIGDASGITETLGTAAVLGITLNYSRLDETEADLFAARILVSEYGSPQGLISLFEKMENHNKEGHDTETGREENDDQTSDEKPSDSIEWILSHPSMDKRIETIKASISTKTPTSKN